MLSAEDRGRIDELGKDELLLEINLGRQSRYQGEKFAYVKTRYRMLLAAERAQDHAEKKQERLKDRWLTSVNTWVVMVTTVASFAFGGGWYQEYEKNQRALAEANQRVVAEYLQPIATLLADNEAIYTELHQPPYTEERWGILESYLIKIRRDGVSKNALMKSRIDTLVQNNSQILTLLTKYASYVKTEHFKQEAAKYRDHAIRYNDRWRSLLEIYVSKGDFPAGAPPFPSDFPTAVREELAARGVAHER